MSLEAQQRHNEAAAYYQRLLTLTAAYVETSHVYRVANWGHARALLGVVGDDHTQLETALGVAQEGLNFVARWPWPWLEPAFHQIIAKVHLRRGQRQAAIDSLTMGLKKAAEPTATLRSSPYDVPTSRQEVEVMLASIYAEENRADKAKQVLEEAVRIREEQLGADHIQVVLAELRLGEFLFTQSEYAAAEQPCLNAYLKLQPYAAAANPIRRRAANQLAKLYTKTGQPGDATQWQSKADAFKRANEENGTEGRREPRSDR
jgi:tetratricopeptide (TPR) repeat protein